MIKIFQYECRRLLRNKFFFGLLLILLFYGWQVLNSITILGVSRTAPFSPWSFGDYLSRMVPLLWIGVMFFLTFFTSSKAQRVNILTDATPVSPRRYAMARCAAALTAAGLLALVCIGEAVFFYRQYFGWYNWGQLLSPALITLIPELIFALGSGWFLGQVRPCLVYVWMSVPFGCIALPLPDALKIWNGQFFRDYPLTLGTLDPAFCIPAGALIVQCTLFAIGIVLLALCPAHFKRCPAH